MKHLQKLSMAFLAILTVMNFAACSDDDNNEGGQGGNMPGTSGKQLVWFREGGSDSDDIVDMHYGSDGWLNTAYSSFGREDDIMYRYESDGGKYTIATSYWSDGDIFCEYTFDNLLRRIDGESCEYDAEGHLTSCGEYTFVWEGGNIVRCESEHEGTVEYTYYTNRENKSPVYPDPLADTLEDFFFLSHPQLLGTWCKNLVKTSTYNHDSNPVTWEYTQDSDGYVTAVKRTDRDHYSYEYRWE